MAAWGSSLETVLANPENLVARSHRKLIQTNQQLQYSGLLEAARTDC